MPTDNICNYHPITTLSIRTLDERFRRLHKAVCYLTSTQGSAGTVSSVGLSMPDAFSVANSPITTSGTLAVTAVGTSAQYIRGDGTLATFPTASVTGASEGLSVSSGSVTLGYPSGAPVAQSLLTDARDVGLNGFFLGFVDNSTNNAWYTDGGSIVMNNSDSTRTAELNVSGSNNVFQLLNSSNQTRLRYDDGLLVVQESTNSLPEIRLDVATVANNVRLINSDGVFQVFSDAYDTALHFSTVTGRQNLTDNRTGVNSDSIALDISAAATVNTTAATRTAIGCQIVVEDSVSAGVNPLTNVGLMVSVNNGDNNYAALFNNGRVGISSNTPTAHLQIGAGSAAAGEAPLKFTAGVNLTTPEAGALEFDGTHFYGTIGSTRYQLDQQPAPATTVASGYDAPVAHNGPADIFLNGTSPVVHLVTCPVDVEVHLPNTSVAPGKIFIIKRMDNSANGLLVVITGGGPGLVEGTSSIGMSAQYSSRTFIWDGTDYWIISSHGD